MSDTVNHPSHYTRGGIECIKAIEASMSPEGFQDYCKGNVLKYIWRWRDKAGVEDLEKARVYLNWLIESAEKNQPKRFLYMTTVPIKEDKIGNDQGKNLKLEHVKIDLNNLDCWNRNNYFHALVNELRICSSSRNCSECTRNLVKNDCNMLESDAADAIEFLLKELKEKENSKEEKKEIN